MSQEVSTFPAGDHKAAMNGTQITKKNPPKSTILERSVRQLLEGFNMFDDTNLILIADVDQDKNRCWLIDVNLSMNHLLIHTSFNLVHIEFYTTLTNFSTKYLVMCNVYTDVGGIK